MTNDAARRPVPPTGYVGLALAFLPVNPGPRRSRDELEAIEARILAAQNEPKQLPVPAGVYDVKPVFDETLTNRHSRNAA